MVRSHQDANIDTLVKGAIAGNKDDLDKLLKNIMRDILHMAILHSNKQEAEDIAQEVSIVLCKKINTLADPQSFWKWLSVIVRNVSIDHMRTIYKLRDIVEYEEAVEAKEPIMESMEFLPEAYVETAELRNSIIEVINSLPKTQEICMTYFYLGKFKRSDIAEVTGLTPMQVSTALHSGKQKIKQMLERQFGESLVFTVAPVGAVPALARVFAYRRDELVPLEWCEQVCQAVISNLNYTVPVPKGSSLSTYVAVACTVATVAVAGTAAYLLYSGGEAQDVEVIPPPVVERPYEPSELDPEEVPWEIRTVADMIGEEPAEQLFWYVDNGVTQEEWESFVEMIGASRDRQAVSPVDIYTTYVLEKQNKRLLLATQDLLTDQINVRYLFGDRDEEERIMGRIILLFD